MAGVTGNGAPRRRQVRAEPAPTSPDPIEIAMEAEASGEAPRGVAHRVLAKQEQLIGWRDGFTDSHSRQTSECRIN